MEEVGITKGNSDLLQVEATVAAAVAASVMVPLVNVPIWVAMQISHWSAAKAPPIAAVLTAIHPAGFVGLLLVSVAAHRKRDRHFSLIS